MSDIIADVLAGTRHYIEQHGLAKGEFREEDGTVCTVGGVMYYLGVDDQEINTDPRVLGAVQTLARVVDRHFHTPEECGGNCTCALVWITTWNDEDERTEQEVLDALAKAEKVERAGFDPDAP